MGDITRRKGADIKSYFVYQVENMSLDLWLFNSNKFHGNGHRFYKLYIPVLYKEMLNNLGHTRLYNGFTNLKSNVLNFHIFYCYIGIF